jgi:hypothetical protein
MGATLPLRFVLVSTVMALGLGSAAAAAADQCLSKTELMDVARMGSVMGLGGALKRCGNCLGDRYQKTVDTYETSGMLVEFRRSEAAVQSSRAKYEYADDLVRVAARKFASDLSADCSACEKTAETVGTLTSSEARSKLYDAEATKISQMPAYKSCP